MAIKIAAWFLRGTDVFRIKWCLFTFNVTDYKLMVIKIEGEKQIVLKIKGHKTNLFKPPLNYIIIKRAFKMSKN